MAEELWLSEPQRCARSRQSLERTERSITVKAGLHDPRSTHLMMLEAFADADHLSLAYENAITERYLWHEFGDLHLIMP
jgi:S-adenosylmethionine:tRNA ribosyltransferase-isomerase